MNRPASACVADGMIDPRQATVVIPAHNEETSIGAVISGVRLNLPDAEIIVVDDGSTDATGTNAEKAGASVLRHPYKKGNGAAVKTGIRNARGNYIVLMDGDAQHNPADIPRLLSHFPDYDMTVGARQMNSQANRARATANGLYNLMATYVTGERISDLTSGFRVVKASLAKHYLYLLPNGFSYPTTLTMALLRAGHSVKYVPVVVSRRTGESKIHPISDGLRFLSMILKIGTLFQPFKVFLPVSMTCLTIGLSYGTYALFWQHRFSGFAQLLIIAGILVFMMGLIAEQIAALRVERTED